MLIMMHYSIDMRTNKSKESPLVLRIFLDIMPEKLKFDSFTLRPQPQKIKFDFILKKNRPPNFL